jgi:hypothetical protein
MALPLSCFEGSVTLVVLSQCPIHHCIVDLGVGESKMSYKLTPISFERNSEELNLEREL